MPYYSYFKDELMNRERELDVGWSFGRCVYCIYIYNQWSVISDQNTLISASFTFDINYLNYDHSKRITILFFSFTFIRCKYAFRYNFVRVFVFGINMFQVPMNIRYRNQIIYTHLEIMLKKYIEQGFCVHSTFGIKFSFRWTMKFNGNWVSFWPEFRCSWNILILWS